MQLAYINICYFKSFAYATYTPMPNSFKSLSTKEDAFFFSKLAQNSVLSFTSNTCHCVGFKSAKLSLSLCYSNLLILESQNQEAELRAVALSELLFSSLLFFFLKERNFCFLFFCSFSLHI